MTRSRLLPMVTIAALVAAFTATTDVTPASAATPQYGTAPSGAPGGGARTTGDRRYEHQLRQLEERVVGLKESVFKAKTRLMLLQEEILQNVIAEAKAVIVHHNDMGSTFTLDRVVYYLDTNRIYVQDNRDGQLDDNESFEIFNGNLVPGNHLLTVEMEYSGNGTLFSYLDGYKFKLKANYTFFAAKGRVIQITAMGYQKGDITTELKDRPSIKFQTQQFQYTKSFALPDGAEAVPGEAE